MTELELLDLLNEVAAGSIKPGPAVQQLKTGPFRQDFLADATPDYHRVLRSGLNEVIFGENKTIDQIQRIVGSLSGSGQPLLITRLDDAKRQELLVRLGECRINDAARTLMLYAPAVRHLAVTEAIEDTAPPYVAIVTAGTSDIPVAEEAKEVCIAMNVAFTMINDVGIAGLHRLIAKLAVIQKASAIVAIAGMEGALPGMVAGLTGKPVFAVPTSVGYGANLKGFSALLTMVNSCASGVSVVNIDNGFSAAFSAAAVVREIEKFMAMGRSRITPEHAVSQRL